MIVITGIRSEIATEDDNHEVNNEEEKIGFVGGNAGVQTLNNDRVISSNDYEKPKDYNELDENTENNDLVEKYKDENHEKVSEEENEDNAYIIDGTEKEQDQISEENSVKTEEIDLNNESYDIFIKNTERTKASLNENISYEHVNNNESNSCIYTDTDPEKEPSFIPKATSLESISITYQMQVD